VVVDVLIGPVRAVVLWWGFWSAWVLSGPAVRRPVTGAHTACAGRQGWRAGAAALRDAALDPEQAQFGKLNPTLDGSKNIIYLNTLNCEIRSTSCRDEELPFTSKAPSTKSK